MVAVFIKIRGAAVHIRHNSQSHIRRVVVTLIYISAKGPTDACPDCPSRNACPLHSLHRCFIAIGLNGVLQLIGNGRNCLIPADLLKLASPRLPTRFIGYSRRSGCSANDAWSDRAGSTCLKIVVSRIVGFHILHFAVFRMPLENAVATTVDIALAPRDGLVCFSSGAFAFLVYRRRAAEH